MKSVIRHLAVALVAALSLLSCASDYDLNIYGSISGKVTDYSTGEPLSAAQVTLVPSANTVQTDADGTFSFDGLEKGQYTVSVQKDGYQANRKNVAVESGETTEIVISLTIIPNN